MTASQHCYLPHALMYTADTSGTQGSNTTPLVDWLRHFPVLPGSSVSAMV